MMYGLDLALVVPLGGRTSERAAQGCPPPLEETEAEERWMRSLCNLCGHHHCVTTTPQTNWELGAMFFS